MKAIIVCHLENDLFNQAGEAKKIPSEKQTFNHVLPFFDWLKTIKISITVSVMVGGQVKKQLLNFIAENKKGLPNNINLGIHYHAENFVDAKWQYQNPLTAKDYEQYYNNFKNTLAITPKTVVFGKWKIDENAYPIFAKLGITHDASKILPKGITGVPEKNNGVTVVPVASFNGRPINPLTRISDYFLIKKIIKQHNHDNLLLHIAFHSYDFFTTDEKPKWRSVKKYIFSDIVNCLRQNKVEVVSLETVSDGSWKKLSKITIPVFSKITQAIKH